MTSKTANFEFKSTYLFSRKDLELGLSARKWDTQGSAT